MSDEYVEDETPLEGEMPGEEMDYQVDDTKANAKTRAWRTAVQGGLFAVILAVAQAVAAMNGAEVNWKLMGLTALQAGATALVSYVQNLMGR